MNKKALILMSTYNGGKNLERQIRSIMDQTGIETHLLIRDDGSDSETIDILKSVDKSFKYRITCVYGSNMGWKRSFMELLFLADNNFDYYGFSDQDDLWLEDKVLTCAEMMDNDDFEGIKLSHCNSLSVDENLHIRQEQEMRSHCPPSHKAAIATEYFQGCGMLWNADAMRLIKKYRPQDPNLAHDYWVGLICYFFGKVYFSEDPKFYHIRYGKNSSEDGNVKLGRIKRLKFLLSNSSAYMNPASDLLRGYKEGLEKNDCEFCSKLVNYRVIRKYKINLIFDREFVRPSELSTILLKSAIFLGRY